MEIVLYTEVKIDIYENVALIEFNRKNPYNPFGNSLTTEITKALEELIMNDKVQAIILTGGVNKSFSVGGDFNEVIELKGYEDVDVWINNLIELYKMPLKSPKPVISAVDNYAVGIGMQLFLMCDWRIATLRSKIILPELANGLSCTLGAHIVSSIFGISIMQDVVYGCKKIDISDALNIKMVNEIVSPEKLIEDSVKRAQIMSSYPISAFSDTKKVVSNSMIEMLDTASKSTKDACKRAFSSGNPQKFMNKILKNKN